MRYTVIGVKYFFLIGGEQHTLMCEECLLLIGREYFLAQLGTGKTSNRGIADVAGTWYLR